jgi:FSR family fosmidomycin resistance protein-like MFS transporter
VAALSVAHLVNDSYGYVLAAALPALIPAHSLSLAMAGLLVAVAQVTASVLQPVIGHLADRGGLRWLVWGGLLAGGCATALVGLAPSFPILLLVLFVAGVGSASFHPSSAAAVVELSGPQDRGRWLGFYITAGNFGLGVGPFAVGPLIERLGLSGTLLLGPPAALMAFLLWRLVPAEEARERPRRASLLQIVRTNRRVLMALLAAITFRSLASGTLTAFLPLLGTARGFGVAEAARVLTTFLIAGSIGTLLGALVSDRLGRDPVIIASLVLSVPFGLVMALGGSADLTFWVSAALCGFFLNGSFAVLALRGQESVPGSVGMMSGMMLGLTIGLGGLGAIPMATLAQAIGLPYATAVAAVLPLLSIVAVRALPIVDVPQSRRGEALA